MPTEPNLQTALQNVLTAVGSEFKIDRAKMGDLNSLSTTNKASLVAALNELQGAISGAGATINDVAASTSSVYSSQKVTDMVTAAINNLIDGAPDALNTFKEFADAFSNDPTALSALTTAVGNRVRFDATQVLTGAQKTQALTNVGGVSVDDIGDPHADLVAVFQTALI